MKAITGIIFATTALTTGLLGSYSATASTIKPTSFPTTYRGRYLGVRIPNSKSYNYALQIEKKTVRTGKFNLKTNKYKWDKQKPVIILKNKSNFYFAFSNKTTTYSFGKPSRLPKKAFSKPAYVLGVRLPNSKKALAYYRGVNFDFGHYMHKVMYQNKN
ncbi:hypothetical protein [Lentilactobacillus sp. Marseille-Q4993]|uniref:hypothetical protein n=1 Tax=Lentilactobacillus sp. Marseille-Q4993 TaxID=3039492 RepID=UPI0024BCD020|nr:hypothetical protein [Lentilactobacillus sp. Marseille-Q4993]